MEVTGVKGASMIGKMKRVLGILFLVLCLGSIGVVTASAGEISDSDLETLELQLSINWPAIKLPSQELHSAIMSAVQFI